MAVMRHLFVGALLLFAIGCGPTLHFNESDKDAEHLLARASHVFVGVIEREEFVPQWMLPRVIGLNDPGLEDTNAWRMIRRRVRLEMVLRGSESRNRVDIYEIFPSGAMTGDWNSTQEGERDLFMVFLDGGQYHLVGDVWRSIFPIYSGKHNRLPLDDSHPFWERYALMNWWVQPGYSSNLPVKQYNDPDNQLYPWRRVKILRGLLRHPSPDLRLKGCEELLMMGRGQDECWDSFPPDQRQEMQQGGWINPKYEWERNRAHESQALKQWQLDLLRKNSPENNARYFMDQLRLYTTMSNSRLRAQFCQLFQKQFPYDHDNGCPPDQPLPASIVTENGDVPLTGPWPQ